MDLLRFTWIATVRRKVLVAAFLVMTLVFHFLNLEPLLDLWLDSRSYQYYIWDCQVIGLYGFVFCLFFAYEYFGHAGQVSMTELLGAYYPQGLYSRMWQLAILGAMILVLTLTDLAYQVIAFLVSGLNSPQVLGYAVEASLLNVTMPMILGAVAGAALSYCTDRTKAYGVMLAVVAVTSPLAIGLTGLMSADRLWLRDLVAVIMLPLARYPDPLYGLPMEDYCWDRILFWIFLGGAALAYLIWGKQSRGAVAACGVMLALSAVSFWGFSQVWLLDADSVIYQDVRIDGQLLRDHKYLDDREGRSEEADFEVLAYDLVLDIDRHLEAWADVAVTPSGNDLYKFTLWYSYDIESVTDAQGVPLEWTQDGLYVTVAYDCPGEWGTLRFRYAGEGGKYYSNDQGIALPGYLPYYPMAGFLDMWDEDQNSVLPQTDMPEKAFRVEVRSDLPLICNLKADGNNCYSGTAQTVTVFGGFLEVVEKNGYTYMDLLLAPKEIDLAAVDAAVEQDLTEMTVMWLPQMIQTASGSKNERFVVFNDHVIADSSQGDMMEKLIQVLNEGYEAADSVHRFETDEEMREWIDQWLEEADATTEPTE